jgi:hypothetical protein
MLARPRTFFGEHVELNFDRRGVELAQPGALVFYGGNESAFADHRLGGDFLLRDAGGNAYGGPAPYVVISLDGTERPELEEWSAQAASAVLLERFFAPDELISQALGVVTESMVLFNDMKYRDKAMDALAKSKQLTGSKRQQERARYEAFLKNIRTKEIRETVAAG